MVSVAGHGLLWSQDLLRIVGSPHRSDVLSVWRRHLEPDPRVDPGVRMVWLSGVWIGRFSLGDVDFAMVYFCCDGALHAVLSTDQLAGTPAGRIRPGPAGPPSVSGCTR